MDDSTKEVLQTFYTDLAQDLAAAENQLQEDLLECFLGLASYDSNTKQERAALRQEIRRVTDQINSTTAQASKLLEMASQHNLGPHFVGELLQAYRGLGMHKQANHLQPAFEAMQTLDRLGVLDEALKASGGREEISAADLEALKKLIKDQDDN